MSLNPETRKDVTAVLRAIDDQLARPEGERAWADVRDLLRKEDKLVTDDRGRLLTDAQCATLMRPLLEQRPGAGPPVPWWRRYLREARHLLACELHQLASRIDPYGSPWTGG